MDAVHVVVLALLQGLTEFLPISSSAHLILLPAIAGWPDQGLAFDVAVHVGTLVAVVAYFRRDLAAMGRDWARSMAGGGATAESRLAWLVIAGTVPIGAAGLAVDALAGDALRAPRVIAGATIAFAVVLWIADRAGRRDRDERSLLLRDVVLIGCAQALALVPGTSRAGITITAGLLLGLSRQASARFSFLLAVPVIALAGGHKALGVWAAGEAAAWGPLAAGAVVSGVFAYLCIHWFLAFVERVGLTPFVVYRLVLGAALLALFA